MSSYPPPQENLPIFDSALFTTNQSTLTLSALKTQFLTFPIGQTATETIPNLAITSSGTAPTPASTSNDQSIATTAFVKANSGISSFTITSSVGTNSWSFTIPNSYGRAFTYSVFSDTNPTTSSKQSSTNPPFSYGAITLNGSFFLATGNAVYQPYSGTSASFVDYCSGFQNIHSISANGGGYVMSVINSMGQTVTWTITSNSVNSTSTQSGATPCPAVASPSTFTTTYTITVPTSIVSCSLVLVGIVVAS
jgi:hypothetical protein